MLRLNRSVWQTSSRSLQALTSKSVVSFHNKWFQQSSIASLATTSSLGAFDRLKLQTRLQKLEEQLAVKNDVKVFEQYIQTLTQLRPAESLAHLERGWQNQKVPVTEELIRQYLSAAAACKKIESINIAGLIALANKSAGVPGSETVNVATILSSSGSGSRFSAGSSPMDPLYVSQQREFSWKESMVKLFGRAVALFVFVSVLGTFLDDKGPVANMTGRTKSAVHQSEHSEKTFKDVVGVDEAKADLIEIVEYLRDPRKFTRLGGRLPKGMLLTGPPGTGKTLLARAIAGEAKVPFFHASGSEFDEMYVGVGAKRIRELFEVAKSKAPCIVFIDEIDAIGGMRQVKDQSAMKMTLNQLLVEMDGFEQNNGVIVIGATNFPDSLDQALLRPGRFDRHVDVPLPDVGGRAKILEYYSKKIPVDDSVDLEQLARGTPGFSGAELFNLINTAALRASVDGLNAVSMLSLEQAKDKILMGAERKSAVISKETMTLTAFHEAGHALVALKTSAADPIHKATIMPRGRALGMVMQLPEGDQTSMSREQMLARLDVCMGGRVAEELVFGANKVTSGASSDIQQANRLARAMVTKYGLSDKVGIMYYDDKLQPSSSAQAIIDQEVRDILEASYNRAKSLLTTNRKDLDTLANGLLEFESLSGSEVVELLKHNGKLPSHGKNKHARSQKPSRDVGTLPTTMEEKGKKEDSSDKKPAIPQTKPIPVAPTVAAKTTSSVIEADKLVPPARSASPSTPATVSSNGGSSTNSSNATASRGPPKA